MKYGRTPSMAVLRKMSPTVPVKDLFYYDYYYY